MMRRSIERLLVCAAAGAGALAAKGMLIEPNDIQFTYHVVGPPSSEGDAISFVQLSDLHIRRVAPMHRTIAARIADDPPDALLFTGDTVDDESGLKPLDEFLSLFDHSLPKFAVLGNWEHWGRFDIRCLSQVYERHNVLLLVNDTASMTIRGRRVLITGVDDLISGLPSIDAALRGVEPGDHHLLLSHSPAYRDHFLERCSGDSDGGRSSSRIDLRDYHFDCILSGHTHGGQVAPFGIRTYMPPGSGRYSHGWYRDASPPLYVSRGIGTSKIPVRLGSKPEVAVFRLVSG